MGKGHFSPTTMTFNLKVHFAYDAVSTQAGLAEWKRIFKWASEMLALATGNQMRIGQIEYVNDKQDSGSGPDLIIMDYNTGESGVIAGLGTGLGHMLLGTEFKSKPGQFLHELGHYAFGLHEEYRGADDCDGNNPNGDVCIPDGQGAACVMQRASRSILLTGNPANPAEWFPTNPLNEQSLVTQFCSDNSTDPKLRHTPNQTLQHVCHTESCWKTMKDWTAGFVDPGTANPLVEPSPINYPASSDNVPAEADLVEIAWVRRRPETRVALALDHSGSMALNRAIEGVKYAAHTWIDLELLLRNELGLVAYSTNATDLVQMGRIELDPGEQYAGESEHDDVDGLAPTDLTNITAALTRARAMIPANADGTIILFSDGIHNVPPPPANVAAQIDLDGIVLHTMSFGAHADKQGMAALKSSTGTWRHVDVPNEPDNSDYEINKELSMLAADSHSYQLAFSEMELVEVLPPWDDVDLGDRPDIERVMALPPGTAGTVDLDVEVDEDMSFVSFVANFRAEDDWFLYLRNGDNDIVVPERHVNFASGEAHATYSFEGNPPSGIWTMRARKLGGRGEGPAPISMFAFGERPLLSLGVVGAGEIYEAGQQVELRAIAQFPAALTNLRVSLYEEGNIAEPIDNFIEQGEGTGRYVLRIPAPDRIGHHNYFVEFVADGTTIEAVQPPQPGEPEPARGRSPGPFRRIKRLQIHVGPLTRGRDMDGGDRDSAKGNPLLRWLRRLWERLVGWLKGLLRR